MSSAYIKQSKDRLLRKTGPEEPFKYFGRSFIKILNKFGLNTSPMRTPTVESKKSVRAVLSKLNA